MNTFNKFLWVCLVGGVFLTSPTLGEEPIMVPIPGGAFQMGDMIGGGDDDEVLHSVTLDAFLMGKYEITNQEYCDFLNDVYPNQIYIEGDRVYPVGQVESDKIIYCNLYPFENRETRIDFDNNTQLFYVMGWDGQSTDILQRHPIVKVSWYGALAFCNWKSQKDGYEACYQLYPDWTCDFTKSGYRLPTEAEWEYAARAGCTTCNYPWDGDISCDRANFGICNPSGFQRYPWTAIVDYQSYQPNNFGLMQMVGNVWEWCWDWYGSYDISSTTNPKGPTSGTFKVFRGGGWSHSAKYCRVSERLFNYPKWRFYDIGFRLVRRTPPLINATIDVDPDTLNKKSNGRWITAFITLPDGYNVADIVPASINIVKIEGQSCPSEYGQPADLSFTPQVGDRDEDGIPDLTVKFDRQTLVNILCIDDVSITIEGNLTSGLKFNGTDKIRVINRGK